METESTKEGDLVSSRIAQLLGERAFVFSPVQLQTIHRRLFDQLLPHAGTYRTYNITKKEWVLKGDSVYYASYDSIEDTLRYDFAQEQGFAYAGLSAVDVAHHIARFVSGVWQIHPFGEGNTRTTAVFAIKYLRTMGYEVNNGPFQDHSWYFRNALVRANYEDVTRGIAPTMTYLERFFQNLLCGTRHELKNRYLHLEWPQQESDQNDQPTPQVTPQVEALLDALSNKELSAAELMSLLSLKDRKSFRVRYLQPALAAGLIERTIPDKPTSRLQRYRKAGR